jgi:hypothetical protein
MSTHVNLRRSIALAGVLNLRGGVARGRALLARGMTGPRLRLSRELPAGFIAKRFALGDATAGPLLPQSNTSVSH